MAKTEPMTMPADEPPAWLKVTPAVFVLFWATGFIGARLSAPDADPLCFLAIRFVIVAAILALAGLVMRVLWPNRTQDSNDFCRY